MFFVSRRVAHQYTKLCFIFLKNKKHLLEQKELLLCFIFKIITFYSEESIIYFSDHLPVNI